MKHTDEGRRQVKKHGSGGGVKQAGPEAEPLPFTRKTSQQ